MVVGLNHETAPVEVRERVSISAAALDDVLETLRNARTVLESVVLSTCNRTEVYCLVSSERAGWDYLTSLLAKLANEPVAAFRSYLFRKSGQDAVHHLFRVACGLDSMILGETQILGQVRGAYLTAVDQGNVGALLNQGFRLAIQTGKQAQTQTAIGQSPVSVSYAAVQLAKKVMGELHQRNVLVIGAGKMSALTVQHLKASGASQVTVTNRTQANALKLGAAYGVEVIPWEHLSEGLTKADVVVTSTAAKTSVLTESMVAHAQHQRNHRPMVLVDIAVPRNIEATVSQVRNTYHFDIDDLNGVIAFNLEQRKGAVAHVEHLIAAAMSDFADWLSAQAVVPVIAAIRQKGLDVESGVMESLRRKLPHLSERDFSLIHKHAMSIVNQLLREPILQMKEQAIAGGETRNVDEFAQLFGVQEALRSAPPVDLMDGFQSVHQVEAFTGLAESLRTWIAAWFREETSLSDRATENPVHSALR